MKFKSIKNSGSALLMALIFAFVVMVMLTGLLYSFRMGLLTTKSIVKNSNEKVLGETYVSNIQDDINFTKTNEYIIGNSKFEIVVDEDDVTSFFPKNGNARLYQGQQYMSFNDIYKAYNRGGDKVDLTKNIIYNAAIDNIYQNFDGDYIPINVPMINVSAITEPQAKSYRLSDGEIEEDYKGFIGFIQVQNQQISIFTKNAKIGVPIPEGMDSEFKVKVGWNLEGGKWSLHLIIHDTNKLFTTSISLEDILADEVKGLEEDNEQLGNEIGNWKPVSNGDSSGGSIGGPFIKENIFDVAWYYEEKDSPPQIVIIRKADQKKGSMEILEAYYSIYSTSDKQYKMKLGGKLNIKRELTEKNIKLLVPDFTNNFDANMALIIHPDNNSKTLMHISDFNYNGDHRVGKSLDTYIDGESVGEPVIVSKNNESIYIITYEPEKLHRYEYKKGYGSFESLEYGENGLEKEFEFEKDESQPKPPPKPKRLGQNKNDEEEEDSDDGIQLVVPKFGYLFVFTKDKVMQLNYDFDILQTIDLDSAVSPQILADIDSVKNTVNKIYIQTTALDMKAQEIKDELGDEDAPEDKNEVKDNSKDKKKSQTRESKLAEIKAKKEADNKDDEEEALPEKIYLDSKYLYPLGIVKQTVL
ncbi:hypothetical protein [Francisella adeliensis]|uniref:Uncharacterized protein n=1 Tax=Francisella adeliensis TaxID=2007306 RepID=A0A2Z4XYR0_9GAMM|nr:hypothetical protein [Francisella adeliensis]AXA33573.1 hypothetical protein CDH04_03730 [Francisella adeliensis]MBK2084719.1 hypothetical protein [Francisella adeliensis]MBK2097338.1 hypothetical protein [Francisella adeliensis]QIW11805.1 hypothetical protein FZC43_03730 [Francisella adeliensis]QIW13681.1 hypothetical protein FZC44_03730 [Francisella adeliensis]